MLCEQKNGIMIINNNEAIMREPFNTFKSKNDIFFQSKITRHQKFIVNKSQYSILMQFEKCNTSISFAVSVCLSVIVVRVHVDFSLNFTLYVSLFRSHFHSLHTTHDLVHIFRYIYLIYTSTTCRFSRLQTTNDNIVKRTEKKGKRKTSLSPS